MTNAEQPACRYVELNGTAYAAIHDTVHLQATIIKIIQNGQCINLAPSRLIKLVSITLCISQSFSSSATSGAPFEFLVLYRSQNTQTVQSSKMPSPDLPQDIVTKIVEYIAHDRGSLMSCALVGPTWVAPCRSLIFRSVTLGPRQLDQNKAETLALLDAVPSLASTTISLTISAGKPQGKHNYPPRLDIDPKFLATLLCKMPALQVVAVERCAVAPVEDEPSMLPPRGWEHPRLRLLRITPSHQVAHVIDTFHIMLFFRHVPVDRLELTLDYDAAGRDPWTNAEQREEDFDAWKRAQYVAAEQYERLRGWRVGILAPTDGLWRLASWGPGEPVRTAAQGVLLAGIADALQLSCWGFKFLDKFRNPPTLLRDKVKVDHLRLEVVGAPKREVDIRHIGWQIYLQCANMQSVTFVFKMQSLVERFSDVLYGDAIPNLPSTMRTIGFEVQLDSPSNISLQLLTLWDKRMQWERMRAVMERFQNLQAVQFGLTLPAGIIPSMADRMRAEFNAIVVKSLPDMVKNGRVRLLE